MVCGRGDDMAKLYFRYGSMGSAKTLNLLAVAHNYRQQGKEIVLIKPCVDTRFGHERIQSRAGLEATADILVTAESILNSNDFIGKSCVLVDEAQFLSSMLVEQLRGLSYAENIPVICYGLRADFRGQLFEGSKRLMELADSIEEVKSTCAFCNRKAIMNLRHVNGVGTLSGEVVQLGAEDRYFPTCYGCYQEQLTKAGVWESPWGRPPGPHEKLLREAV
jgi:thymidine kinase